ncbi:hypothetical protein Tco_0768813 [Tanacetum coccineum]
MSMDDLYNNIKVYELEVKGTSSSNTSTQNLAFVSSNNSGSTNEAVNNAHGVSASSSTSTRGDTFLGSAELQETKTTGAWKAQEESDKAEEGPTNYALMAYSSSSFDFEVSNDFTCSKSCLETVEVLKSQYEQLFKRFKKSELMVVAYKTVPPPLIGNFMPLKPDLSFTGLEEFTNEPVVIKPVVENSKAKASKAKPKAVRKNNGALIIEVGCQIVRKKMCLKLRLKRK